MYDFTWHNCDNSLVAIIVGYVERKVDLDDYPKLLYSKGFQFDFCCVSMS